VDADAVGLVAHPAVRPVVHQAAPLAQLLALVLTQLPLQLQLLPRQAPPEAHLLRLLPPGAARPRQVQRALPVRRAQSWNW
jgi:hypothetical protein